MDVQYCCAVPASGSAKRTRAQQREETVTALLNATLASLVEDGLTATTTRRVAERAGVSQGAVQYYFPVFADLLDAALRRMADDTTRLATAAFATISGSERERVAALIDTAWMATRVPIGVGLDFVTAARTDPDISTRIGGIAEHAQTAIMAIARMALPDLIDRPGAQDWIRVTMLTIYGGLLASCVPPTAGMVPEWKIIRGQIMASFDTWIENAPLSSSN